MSQKQLFSLSDSFIFRGIIRVFDFEFEKSMKNLLPNITLLFALAFGIVFAIPVEAGSITLTPGTGVIYEGPAVTGIGVLPENASLSAKLTAILAADGKSLVIEFKNTTIGTGETWLSAFDFSLGGVGYISGTFSGVPAGSNWTVNQNLATCCRNGGLDFTTGGLLAGKSATLTLSFVDPQQSLSFSFDTAGIAYFGSVFGTPRVGGGQVVFAISSTITPIPAPVPEPTTLLLIGSGLVAMSASVKRKKNSK